MKNYLKYSLLLFGISIAFNLEQVFAISKELIKQDDYFTIPLLISSNGSKITVRNTTDYILYGEWLEITLEKYNEIEAINDEMDKISDEFSNYTKENSPNREKYLDDGQYNEAVKEYNAKLTEYKEKINTLEDKYYETIPNFDDTKWEPLIDDKVYLPTQEKTTPYILFIKLDDKTNSLIDYDFAVLEVKGDENNTENINDSNIINEEEQNVTDTTVNNPQTGFTTVDSFVIISSLLLISVFLILKRKNKLFKI